MIKFFKRLSKYKKRTALINDKKKVSYDEIVKNLKNFDKIIDENSVSLLIADNNINFINFYQIVTRIQPGRTPYIINRGYHWYLRFWACRQGEQFSWRYIQL